MRTNIFEVKNIVENYNQAEREGCSTVSNRVIEAFGLEVFGAKGDKFDPELHNALVQTPSPEVTENVIADVISPGYKLGDRLIRPAMVAVFIPEAK